MEKEYGVQENKSFEDGFPQSLPVRLYKNKMKLFRLGFFRLLFSMVFYQIMSWHPWRRICQKNGTREEKMKEYWIGIILFCFESLYGLPFLAHTSIGKTWKLMEESGNRSGNSWNPNRSSLSLLAFEGVFLFFIRK